MSSLEKMYFFQILDNEVYFSYSSQKTPETSASVLLRAVQVKNYSPLQISLVLCVLHKTEQTE